MLLVNIKKFKIIKYKIQTFSSLLIEYLRFVLLLCLIFYLTYTKS